MENVSDTDFELVVGLEVHIQLATDSKLFASDATRFDADPNTNVSEITLAHPGTMPKLNRKAIEYAVRLGLACESSISRYCIFDRKNYFYPDLPKGFQTTQDSTPICIGGHIEVEVKGAEKSIVQLNRIHLEEDAGKSIHDLDSTRSMIDLNRAGIPLVELVTEPCIGSAEEAMSFLKELRNMVRFLEICDGNMEQGSLRCDANISVRKVGDYKLGSKVEVKNMNSMRNVGKAIKYEFERQSQLLGEGESIISETRLFDVQSGSTSAMRTKEELNDYRYFPEPDLSPFTISDEYLDSIRESMPDTPKRLRKRFVEEYKLSDYDAEVLTSDKELAKYFLNICEGTTAYKEAANWVQGPIKALMSFEDESIQFPIDAEKVSELVNLIDEEVLSKSVAKKELLPYLIENKGLSVSNAIENLNLGETGNADISDVVLEVLNAFPDKVVAYKNGKKNLLGLFMGEVMKGVEAGVDPKKVKSSIEHLIAEKK